MKVLGLDDLKGRGIPFSRQHIHRLIRQGKFPRPFKIGDRTNGWTDEEIDQYLKTRIAERDSAA